MPLAAAIMVFPYIRKELLTAKSQSGFFGNQI